MASTCWNCHSTLRNGTCPKCDSHALFRVPASQADPKDQRIAELEAAGQAWVELHNRQYREMEAERDQLRARVQELEREHAVWEKHGLCEIVKERDAARAECERMDALAAKWQAEYSESDAANRRLEAHAARMREALQFYASEAGINGNRAREALAETDAGALVQGLVEALSFYADKASWSFTWHYSVSGEDSECADKIDFEDVETHDDETTPWVAGKHAREALDAWTRCGRGRDGE